MIVQLAGRSGSGKSTLTQLLVAAVVSEHDSQLEVSCYVSDGSNAEFGTTARLFALISSMPEFLKVLSMRDFWTSKQSLRLKVSGLSVMAQAQRLRKSGRTVLVDQAHLSVPSWFVETMLLPKFWWPDVVVEVIAARSQRSINLKARRNARSQGGVSERAINDARTDYYLHLIPHEMTSDEVASFIGEEVIDEFDEWIQLNSSQNQSAHIKLMVSPVAIPGLKQLNREEVWGWISALVPTTSRFGPHPVA